MQPLNLKPTHKLVTNYYEVLGQFGQLEIDHEGAVRSAFQDLLKDCGRKLDLILEPEYSFPRPKLNPLRIDGALLDTYKFVHGYWEAKDEHDDLDKEIRAKLERGYPRSNIIFQAPERAVLYQHGMPQGSLNQDIRDPKNLVELLKTFFAYRPPHFEEWQEAVAEFKEHIPQIAAAVQEKIEEQHRTNPAFVKSFDAFYEVCRQSINPNLSVPAVEKMLVQHLLTERIFRRIFDNPDFTRRNVIAVEIEKVIDSMTAKQFSRDAFLKDLDRFYRAIESAAENTETYKQKQDFINTVYERFFQGYSPKEADTHGIVYTPQPIVDFMVRSVEDILNKEFGRSLSDKGVHILDPFVGTGNFITRVMKEIKTSALPYKYENELHCNEVMLLPYYVASMNIEHEYMERTGEYKPFPGICLVDTFELAEPEQAGLSFMTEENTERVKRQKESSIFVVIGNPPYNMGQVNENDQNKNRYYKTLDARVATTYTSASTATLRNKLRDPYVKAIRWATDRIGSDGIVAFVTNDSFVDQKAFDGMRKHLSSDFDTVYILDLGGNVRRNPTLSGTTHNVFGIQIGVSINLFVRHANTGTERAHTIYYAGADRTWRKEQKYELLDRGGSITAISWRKLNPDCHNNWLREGARNEFDELVPIMGKVTRDTDTVAPGIFNLLSLGLVTNRDAYAYSFDACTLQRQAAAMIEAYETALARRSRASAANPTSFIDVQDKRIKWTRQTIAAVGAGRGPRVNEADYRVCQYRPFAKRFLLFSDFWNEEQYQNRRIFPLPTSDNLTICATGVASEKPFMALASSSLADLHLVGPGCGTQVFPFYTYDEDGANRHENITDWALSEFRTHYRDPNITKWDIFHYVYAVLHHPEYRERYAANLKRELPRIPFVGADASSVLEGAGLQASRKDALNAPSTLPKASAQPTAERHKEKAGPSTPSAAADCARDDKKNSGSEGRGAEAPLYPGGDGMEHYRGPSTRAGALAQDDTHEEGDDKSVFWAFVNAGRELAELHVNYEQQREHPLERVEKGQLNWRVEKMRLSKDKTTLVYNDFLTLKGIPPETYEYRLGNRSALEWVIDQYQVSTDKRSAIVNDPNRADDPEYIVRLIGQVITVSLETMKIVKALPPLAVVASSDNPQSGSAAG